jgi:hypothetical protein
MNALDYSGLIAPSAYDDRPVCERCEEVVANVNRDCLCASCASICPACETRDCACADCGAPCTVDCDEATCGTAARHAIYRTVGAKFPKAAIVLASEVSR